MRSFCQHCLKNYQRRPRGLCDPCYRNLAVRLVYPAVEYLCRRGYGQTPGCGKRLPIDPTGARPGSEEKIQVLSERASRGEALYHPLDARLDEDWRQILLKRVVV